jgi:UDP-2,4-diacetamido-2,4,6-trideoxy-beta-L-altropyranose hydrolase
LKILFCVEASKMIGLGHLSRCRSLALEIYNKFGYESIFAVKQKLLAENFLAGMRAQIVHPEGIHANMKFDIAITDIPSLSLPDEEKITRLALFNVGINDDGAGPFSYDILVRPNLVNTPTPIGLNPHFECWKGREYIILHPDFAEQDASFTVRPAIKKIIVCFGGSDPSHLTHRVIHTLDRNAGDAEVVFVLGPAFDHREALEEMISGNIKMKLKVNCPTMAEEFASADIAVISGGTLLYEACAVGVPSIVICQNEEQDQEAKIFHKAGAIINLGVQSKIDNKNILSAMEAIFDKRIRQKMSEIDRGMVSPDGTRRIVSKIMGYKLLKSSPGL